MTHAARSTWAVLVWIILVMLPVQFYLAGYGAFSFTHGTVHAHDTGWGAHAAFGLLIGLVVVLQLVAALVARLPQPVPGMAAGLLVLLIAQVLLGASNASIAAIGALHAVNALLIVGLVVHLAMRSRGYLPGRRST